MEEIRLKARAKINLTLDVTGKREDGYHTLCMLMQTVGLYDGVYIKKIDKPLIRLKTNWSWLPNDERNLAFRAAQLIREHFHIKSGVYIELNKKIPVAAGLAGGSSDCAAVLVGMNRLFHLGLSQKQLMHFALKMGTDIPYCVLRGTALAQNLGEELTPVFPPCPPCYVLLAKPAVNVSTAFVYKNLQLEKIGLRPNTPKMLEAIQKGSIPAIGKQLVNVLESVTIPLYPQIQEIKNRMKSLGAEGALMSGSGPTVFGLFSEQETAKLAADKIKKEFQIRDVILTSIWDKRRGERYDRL